MHKIYLDTNVILEHALQRENYKDVVSLFHLAKLGVIECYTSTATFFTIAFFLQNMEDNRYGYKKYFSFITAIETSQEDLIAAVNSSFSDIEDGLQYFSALRKCDVFVTFNQKDFLARQNEKLPCLVPSEFLKRIR